MPRSGAKVRLKKDEKQSDSLARVVCLGKEKATRTKRLRNPSTCGIKIKNLRQQAVPTQVRVSRY
jgi:hypothetical protein